MNRLVAWFAANPVAANLLMVGMLAAGLLAAPSLNQEIFPEVSLGMVTISVAHEGAAPDEIESGICVPIEEAIHGIRGVRRVTSTAVEGFGTVVAELERRADTRRVLADIETQVDGIDHFPEEAERPVIRELFSSNPVIDVAIHGDLDPATLKSLGEHVRDEILALPGISKVELTGVKPYQISIEVSEPKLRRHGLLFDDVVAAVRRSSLDLPGGSLRTAGGEILLRTRGQAEWGPEFGRIVLLSRPDGTRLLVGDVANVVDGFAEAHQSARIDGSPAVVLHVMRASDERLIDIAERVKAYVGGARARMPEGARLVTRQDYSAQLASRRDLMLENGAQGLLLVLISLALFLRLRLALWVSAGMLVSFLGAVAVMPLLDVSLSMISSLAFMVALGLVTDDAIVVGERIVQRQSGGSDPLAAAVRGARELAVPVTIAGLTTMLALFPALLLPGVIGAQAKPLPLVAIACLAFSLVESLLVLPAHLGHRRAGDRGPGALMRRWDRFQGGFARGLDRFIQGAYRPALRGVLRHRALTLSLAWVVLAATLGAVVGGWVPFTFLPKTEADKVTAILSMPPGTRVDVTDAMARRIEAAALELRRELGESAGRDAIRDVYTSIGEQPEKISQNFFTPLAWTRFSGSHVAEVQLELVEAEARSLSAAEIGDRWRRLVGPLPDADELVFVSSFFSTASPINVQLEGTDSAPLEAAAERLESRLREFPGVIDVASSHREGKRELQLEVAPEAEAYGISMAAAARQIRQAFHGEEVQRIQRGREDVPVVVRYPDARRRSLSDLEDMSLRTPERDAIPFSTVVRARVGRGWASIQRADRKRTVNVIADVDTALANAHQVMGVVEAEVLPAILAEHPGVGYRLEGQQRDQREFMAVVGRALVLILLAIYALFATTLRSYSQPALIMVAIPFGLVGAVWGHLALGLDVSGFSMIGMVGLVGVVVNSSLVLLHTLNGLREQAATLEEAVERACVSRFRPIIVTALTTCLGLTPLLFETSTQALWIKPMAVSLAFGELFGTIVVLVIVPAAILVLGERASGRSDAGRHLSMVEPARAG